MPSRGEQLQSYQFMVQRVVSALVLRETDPPQSPFRRAASAALASLLVTVVIAAGFGIYSIFTGGGNQRWQAQGTVVVEKNTAAAFLFHEGKLWPALNLTSAILASTNPKPNVMTVSTKSLHSVPWGQMIGIPLLPNSLAPKKELVGYPWSICAMQGKDGPISAVVAGTEEISRGRAVGPDEAMIVRSTVRGSTPYVLWRGRLFETKQATADRLAQGVQIATVSPAFLNGLPKGDPIEPLAVTNRDAVSKFDPTWKVGEVITMFGVTAEDRFVLVREDGLFYVTQVQAQIAAISGRHRLSFGDVTANNSRTISTSLLPKEGDPRTPPSNLPRFTPYNGSGVCSVVTNAAGNTELRADVPIDLGRRPQTARRSNDGTTYADYVLMPTGKGAIVASGQTYSYVSRDGVRFAAANLEVLKKLGYEGAAPVQLSPSLVSLLPEGPGLDPTEAMVPVTVA
jgi:type VII secretion protein EccB